MALDIIAGQVGESMGGATGTTKKLSASGARSMDEWLDFIRDSHDFTDIRRQQLVNSIYDVRKQAAQEALSVEMGRLGVIKKADRAKLMFALDDNSPYAQQLRRRAEQQAERIIATDRAFREQWAAERKKNPYPVRNRHQLNAELREELAKRSPWKSKQIAETEWQQGAAEAVTDFYKKTEITDPDTEAAWYFWGPRDKKTCGVCNQIMDANPHTMHGLVAMLADLGAMAPEAFCAHPHERHMADFRPKAGVLRKGENRDAAKGWAQMHGMLQNRETGEKFTPPGPKNMPKWLRTAFPETASQALAAKVCGITFAKELLWKWAFQVETAQTFSCETLTNQQLSDAANKMVQQLFGGSLAGKGAKADLVLDDMGIDVRAARVSGGKKGVSIPTKETREREAWLQEKGLQGRMVTVVVDDPSGGYVVYYHEGIGSADFADMRALARIDANTGKVQALVDELPWKQPGGTLADDIIEVAEEAEPVPLPKTVLPVGSAKLPDNLTTPNDIAHWMKSNLPLDDYDMGRVDAQFARPLAEQVVDIYNSGLNMDGMKFGSLSRKEFVQRFHDDMLAVADDDLVGSSNYIFLNEGWFTDEPKMLLSQLKYSVEKQWNPIGCDNVESVISHEIGHDLRYKDPEFNTIISEWWDEWDELGEKGGSISGYAKESYDEMMAEGFSSLLHTPPNEWSEPVKDLAARLEKAGYKLKYQKLKLPDVVDVEQPETVTPQLAKKVCKIPDAAPAKEANPDGTPEWLVANLHLEGAKFTHTEVTDDDFIERAFHPEAAMAFSKQMARLSNVMPPKLRDEILPKFALRAEKLDGLYGNVYTSKYGEWKASLNLDVIQFGEQWAATKDAIAHGGESGWAPKGTGTAEAIFTHEFGHIISLHPSTKHIIREWTDAWTDDERGTISKYAQRNWTEAFSEGFRAVMHQPPEQWNKPVADLAARLEKAGFSVPKPKAEVAEVAKAAEKAVAAHPPQPVVLTGQQLTALTDKKLGKTPDVELPLPPLRKLEDFDPQVAAAVQKHATAEEWEDILSLDNHKMPLTDEERAWTARALDDGRGPEVAVSINAKNLTGFIKAGRYKTHHEINKTGAGGGATKKYRQIRRDLEKTLWDYDDETLPLDQHPVSGTFMQAQPGKLICGAAKQYGDIDVIVRPDVVDTRCTFTPGDSLDGQTYSHYPSINRKQAVEARQYHLTGSSHDMMYTEAQIHGGLRLEDVAEIRIPEEQAELVETFRTMLAKKAPHIEIKVADRTHDEWMLSSPHYPEADKQKILNKAQKDYDDWVALRDERRCAYTIDYGGGQPPRYISEEKAIEAYDGTLAYRKARLEEVKGLIDATPKKD